LFRGFSLISELPTRGSALDLTGASPTDSHQTFPNKIPGYATKMSIWITGRAVKALIFQCINAVR